MAYYNELSNLMDMILRENRVTINHFLEPWKMDVDSMDEMCTNIPLTETYIREFANWLNWDLICEYQKLSKSFLDEFTDKVNWSIILKKENWSEDFIDQHTHLIPTNTRKNSIKNELCWEDIFRNDFRSRKFFFKHYENLNWKSILNGEGIKEGQIFNMYKDLINETQLWKKYLKEDRWNCIITNPYGCIDNFKNKFKYCYNDLDNYALIDKLFEN